MKLRLARALIATGGRSEARLLLEEIGATYPGTSAGVQAHQLLDGLGGK